MNNAKWDKLIEGMTNFVKEVFVNYKLIYTEEVFKTSFFSSDFKPFFIEPILYKEVEWIAVPRVYENYVNRNNIKSGTKEYTQDLESILIKTNGIGYFDTEYTDESIKIYAYK